MTAIENIQNRLADKGSMAPMDELQDAVTLAQSNWPPYERDPWHDLSKTAVALAADQPMTLAESTLETAISVTCADLALAITEEELHAQRTPGMVAYLERARGLR